MTFVFLALVAKSEFRCCRKIMEFGPFLRRLSKVKASIAGAWEFVWASTQVVNVRMWRPPFDARRPLFVKPLFAIWRQTSQLLGRRAIRRPCSRILPSAFPAWGIKVMRLHLVHSPLMVAR